MTARGDTGWPTETIHELRQSKRTRQAGLVAIAYVGSALVHRFVPLDVFGIHVDFGASIVFVASLLVGPAAAWGGAIGVLVTDVISGTFGFHTAFSYAGYFLLAVTVYRLWPLESESRPTRWIWRGIVVLTGALVVTAIVAWGGEVTGRFRFLVGARTAFPGTLLGMLLVGIPISYVITRYVTRSEWSGDSDRIFRERSSAVRSRMASVAVPLIWILTGLGINIVLQPITLVSAPRLELRLGEMAVKAVGVVGSHGRFLQIVLGSLFVIAFLWALREQRDL